MMTRCTRLGVWTVLSAVVLLTTLVVAGCMTPTEWERWVHRNDKKDSQPTKTPRMLSQDPAIRDTIAPLVTIQGIRLNQVRGFGLVVDLVDTGGRDGPEIVRNHLIKEIRRRQAVGVANIPAVDMLRSRDTVMVELTGYVPAGATKGDKFDVAVRALGSEAKSIVGGRLVLGDLRVYAETPSGVLSSHTLALASGPIFVSPFDRNGDPTNKVDLRRGVVLGGGHVTDDRKIRLVLNDPRHSMATRITRALNGRWGRGRDIAKGESAGMIELLIPEDRMRRKRVFLEQVLHTNLLPTPTAVQKRQIELLHALVEPDADGNSIGLTLEAIGKIALPELRRLFNHESPNVAYYAARTGIRLEDREAVDVIARFANDPESEFRRQAIDELGWSYGNSRVYAAGEYLRKLLDDEDTLIRIDAYKALRRRPHPAIETRIIDEDNFILDVIETKGPFVIYVQRANAPRIALFGKTMACTPPAMFPGNRIDGRTLLTQLSAEAGDESLAFFYTNKRTGIVSPQLSAPLQVSELLRYLGDTPTKKDDGTLAGHATPYSELLDILSTFSETGTIQAKLVLEGLEDEDKNLSRQRPESDY